MEHIKDISYIHFIYKTFKSIVLYRKTLFSKKRNTIRA